MPGRQTSRRTRYGIQDEPEKVGLTGLEPVTPALSAQCSNRLSYRPKTLTAKEWQESGDQAPPIKR